MVKDAPVIDLDDVGRSARRRSSTEIHEEFCFVNEQSKVHALARIITPFARGPPGVHDPSSALDLPGQPTASRQGLPRGDDHPYFTRGSPRRIPPSTGNRRKPASASCRPRETAGVSCTSQIAPARLDDIHLTQAITNERITARRLGSNEASSDLSRSQLDGVLDLGQHRAHLFRGHRRAEPADLPGVFRRRKPTRRKFKNPFLAPHRARTPRGGPLGDCGPFPQLGTSRECRSGKEVFTTYPQWAEIVGGVMAVNDLGDPCQPFKRRHVQRVRGP